MEAEKLAAAEKAKVAVSLADAKISSSMHMPGMSCSLFCILAFDGHFSGHYSDSIASGNADQGSIWTMDSEESIDSENQSNSCTEVRYNIQ